MHPGFCLEHFCLHHQFAFLISYLVFEYSCSYNLFAGSWILNCAINRISLVRLPVLQLGIDCKRTVLYYPKVPRSSLWIPRPGYLIAGTCLTDTSCLNFKYRDMRWFSEEMENEISWSCWTKFKEGGGSRQSNASCMNTQKFECLGHYHHNHNIMLFDP